MMKATTTRNFPFTLTDPPARSALGSRHQHRCLRETDSLPDLGQLARMVAPVNRKEDFYPRRNRDLVGAQKRLEQRNASLPLKILVPQRLEVAKTLPADAGRAHSRTAGGSSSGARP